MFEANQWIGVVVVVIVW